jgi:hypothetical protein
MNVSVDQRAAVLASELAQVVSLKQKGYDVTFHLFAENKNATAEGTDWSYWGSSSTTSAHTTMFKDLTRQLHVLGINLWLFDE